MDTVRSSDGTTIAFDRLGVGPSVILVSGASTARAIHAQLAELLAADFTVCNYDRRGRGDSGDTPPYAVQREVEDLHAVLGAAGGAAAVFGNSSGAVLALHTAAAGLPITKLALWEPPFMVDPDAPRRQQAYVAELTELLDAGRRGDAMALFMRTIGLPEQMIAGMRQTPMWPDMEALAPTLVPSGLVASVTAPTLVLDGSDTGPGRRMRPGRSPPPFPTHSVVPSKARPTTWPGTSSPPSSSSSSPGNRCMRDEAVAGPRGALRAFG
jgi:Alpha/beta hydrolase family